MKISASVRFVRVSPSKVMPFARLIKGLSVEEALNAASFAGKKGAFHIAKLLKSMIANLAAAKLNADDFRVEQVAVEQGPGMKRFWSRSRGMARPVVKRSSHIRIVLNDNKSTGKE